MSSYQTILIIPYLKSDKGEDRIASDWIDGIDRALPDNNTKLWMCLDKFELKMSYLTHPTTVQIVWDEVRQEKQFSCYHLSKVWIGNFGFEKV